MNLVWFGIPSASPSILENLRALSILYDVGKGRLEQNCNIQFCKSLQKFCANLFMRPQELERKDPTVPINELLCIKNAGAQIAMDFS